MQILIPSLEWLSDETKGACPACGVICDMVELALSKANHRIWHVDLERRIRLAARGEFVEQEMVGESRRQGIDIIRMLKRRDVITLDPNVAEECCGIPRDEDGFCQHRGHHPIFVKLS